MTRLLVKVKRSTSETVRGSALSLEGIDNIKRFFHFVIVTPTSVVFVVFGDVFCVFVVFGDVFCGFGIRWETTKGDIKKGKMIFAFFLSICRLYDFLPCLVAATLWHGKKFCSAFESSRELCGSRVYPAARALLCFGGL